MLRLVLAGTEPMDPPLEEAPAGQPPGADEPGPEIAAASALMFVHENM